MYKQRLLSLIGKLSFACKVITAGRKDIHKAINHNKRTISWLHHHNIIEINQQAHPDIEWWLTVLPTWNCTSVILEIEWSTSTFMSLYTDGASSVGWKEYWCGGWIHQLSEAKMEKTMKRLKWKKNMKRNFCHHSSTQHLGSPLGMQKVFFHYDNQAVVDIRKQGPPSQ